MSKTLRYIGSTLALTMLAVSINAAASGETVDIIFTAPLVIGETDRASGRIDNLSPDAKRLGINGIRVSGEVKLEKQNQAESRLQVRWTDVSVDNEAGDSVSGTLEKPLESRFRTQAGAIRPGNQVKARGDMAGLNKALESIMQAQADSSSAGGENRQGEKDAEKEAADRVSRTASGGNQGSMGSDPDQYMNGAQLTPTNDACSPAIDGTAGTVTPQTKRVVLDGEGNVVAEGGCVPSGTAASIQTDYLGCPIHIDHQEMKAYRTYRKYALVDGKSMEIQGCTVDLQKEIERKRDYAKCSVMIPEMEVGKSVYPAYRWVGLDRDAGKEFIISDCIPDDVKWPLASVTASCPDYVDSRQAGRIYPQEKLVYRDQDGVEHVAVNCRKVEEHPGFAVVETHEGCDSAQLENAAGKILVRPKTRLIYYDADGVQRQARACEPSALTTEVNHQVTGWTHSDNYSELKTVQTYKFQGIDWYWKDSKPTTFARVDHTLTTDGCSGTKEDFNSHITMQSTRAILDVRDAKFDVVRNQLNADSLGFVEGRACNDKAPNNIPHISNGWSEWRVVSSREVREEMGRSELAPLCTVKWSNSTSHAINIRYVVYDSLGDGSVENIQYFNGSKTAAWNHTVQVNNRAPVVSDLPSSQVYKSTLPASGYYASRDIIFENSRRGVWQDGELASACQSYRGQITKSITPNATLTGSDLGNGKNCSNSYSGCERTFTVSNNLNHVISWERQTLNTDTGLPFTWAHPESPWNSSNGCADRANPVPGDTTQMCNAISQTRERYRVWKRPILDQTGKVSSWELYEDDSQIDRQVSYLINK